MSTAIASDATWAAAFFSGLLNASGLPSPPPSKPILKIEKDGDQYTAWLSSSGMPIQIQSIDTKGQQCMATNGYMFDWALGEHTLYNGLLTRMQKVHAHEGAMNFYDALKQCNVETDIKFITQVQRRQQHALLSWKDAV